MHEDFLIEEVPYPAEKPKSRDSKYTCLPFSPVNLITGCLPRKKEKLPVEDLEPTSWKSLAER
jgi:hypothetical protein